MDIDAIAEVLSGERSYDDLPDSEDQAFVRTEWGQRLDARIADTNLAAEFVAQGRGYAIVDDEGIVLVVDPTKTRAAPWGGVPPALVPDGWPPVLNIELNRNG